MAEWKPIETAEFVEFKTVLLFDTEIGVCTGYWCPPEPDEGLLGEWMVQDNVGEYIGDVTHWMLMPEPPSQ